MKPDLTIPPDLAQRVRAEFTAELHHRMRRSVTSGLGSVFSVSRFGGFSAVLINPPSRSNFAVQRVSLPVQRPEWPNGVSIDPPPAGSPQR